MKLHTINEFLFTIRKVSAIDDYGVKRKRELRIYKNPSMSELKELYTSMGNIAGFTHSDNVYVWNREFSDHKSVIEKSGLRDDDIIAFYLDLSPSDDIEIVISTWSTSESNLSIGEEDLIDRVLNIIHKRMVDQRK